MSASIARLAFRKDPLIAQKSPYVNAIRAYGCLLPGFKALSE